jgi:hypothetical protein
MAKLLRNLALGNLAVLFWEFFKILLDILEKGLFYGLCVPGWKSLVNYLCWGYALW